MLWILTVQLSDTLWVRTYPRLGEQKVFRAVKSPNGLVVVGYTTERGDKDVFVAEIDTNGNLIFATVYGDSGVDEVGRAIEDVGDGYVVVGWRGSVGSRDAYVLKMDYVGNVLWDTTYDAYGEMGDNGLYGAVYDTLRGVVWGVGFMRWSWDTAYTGWLLGIDPASGDSVKATVVDFSGTTYELLYDVAVRSDGKVAAVGKLSDPGVGIPMFYAAGFLMDTTISVVESTYVFSDFVTPGTQTGVATVVESEANPGPFYENIFVSGGIYYVGLEGWSSPVAYPMGVLRGAGNLYESAGFAQYYDSTYNHMVLSSIRENDTLALIVGFMGDMESFTSWAADGASLIDTTDTTQPYSPIIDTVGERSAKILVAEFFLNGLYPEGALYGLYDFPRTDVGVGARFVQGAGDSTDILIVGYSNSFSGSPEDYDLIALRVRPDRLGVFERVVSLDGGEGVVEVYDVSGRLVGRGERLEDIRLRRGVFFVKEGRKVRRVVVR